MTNETLDAGLIQEQIESGEQIRYTKPVFAQAWVIAIIWVVALAAFNVYNYLSGYVYPYLLVLLALMVVYSIWKYFTNIRSVELAGDAVKIYSLGATPAKEFRLSQLSAIIDNEEIYLIKRGKYAGGATLRKAYWGRQWKDMKEQFRFRSAWASSGDTGGAGLGNSPAMGTRASSSPISTFALLYEIALSPYFALARIMSGNK